ncbi:MAG: DUF6600 domain-containing protein [Pseudomarimonas sp.]
MNIAWRFLAIIGLLLGLATSVVEARNYDPPSRVAYLSHSDGIVSYSPAGEDVWLDVIRNRPLVRGDRLWTERRAVAELQVGSASLRLDEGTSLELLELDDDFAQLQVAEGTLALSVRRLARGQVIEVATPNLAVSIDQPGRYRIDVNPDRNETTVVVWQGAAEAYGERSEFSLLAGEAVRFYSSDLRDYEIFGLPRDDSFDRYCLDRDRQISRSVSLRYLDDDTAGFSALDEYGSWRSVSSYGNVWFPATVERDWAPYRDGRWIWQEPWGWTWVDNAPWGFAPSHYGRWAFVSNRWGWIPGPRNVRAVYAPALVAFVGGSRWSLSFSGGNQAPIGWFPLGPREIYVPSYQASRDYFSRVNVNNTVINVSVINTVYGNYSRGSLNVGQIEYANRGLPGAVTAVPSSVFINSRSVRQEAIRLQRNGLANAENLRVAAVAPSRRAVLGAAAEARGRPARDVFERRVMARTPPPPEQRSFADREQLLQRTPGRAGPPTVATPDPQRSDIADNVRVLQAERRPVDARERGSRRRSDDGQADSGAPQALERGNQSPRTPTRTGPDSIPTQSPADMPPARSRPPRGENQQIREPEQATPTPSGAQAGGERQREGAGRDRPVTDDRDAAARTQQRQPQDAENRRQEAMRAQRAQQQAESEAAAREGQQRDAAAVERQRENAGRERQMQGERDEAAREQRRQQQAVENQRQAELQGERQREQEQREAAERERVQRDEGARQRQQAEQQAAENQRQADDQANQQREQQQREAEERERSQRDEEARQQQAEQQEMQRQQREQQQQREAEERERAQRDEEARQQQAEQQEMQRQQREAEREAEREEQQARQREAEESAAAERQAEAARHEEERARNEREGRREKE